MKTKRLFQWLPAAAALLLTTACSSDNDLTTNGDEGQQVKVIHYEATVGNTTRATLNEDNQYTFAAGDQLYVSGTNVSGVLTLKSGGEGQRSGVTFEGDLNYTGEGSEPDGSLSLTGILVSSNDALYSISDGKVTGMSYPTEIASSLAEAVQKYGQFTAKSTYSAKSFSLEQASAFLNFTVTLKDGTAAGTDVNVKIENDGNEVGSGTVTTTKVNSQVVAQFAIAFAGDVTTLNNASVTLDSRDAISFGGSTTLAKNTIYNIKKAVGSLEFVDLGLTSGTLWAKVNVGATSETEYGDYFAWGGTTGYDGDASDGHSFTWANTPYYTGDGTTHSWSKYNGTDGLTALELADDAAYQWDNDCRMPTADEFIELVEGTTVTKYFDTTYNGVAGVMFTNKTDNTKFIFLPAGGDRSGTTPTSNKDSGYYWASSCGGSVDYASFLVLSKNNEVNKWNVGNLNNRYFGRNIRAVKKN